MNEGKYDANPVAAVEEEIAVVAVGAAVVGAAVVEAVVLAVAMVVLVTGASSTSPSNGHNVCISTKSKLSSVIVIIGKPLIILYNTTSNVNPSVYNIYSNDCAYRSKDEGL